MNRDFMGALRERVLVFDGAMGTMLQTAGLSLDDYQGLEGCSEILCVSRPDVVRDIHAAYFEAGADAVETNSFGSSVIVLAEYDIADQVVPLNRLAAELAREVADDFQADGRPRWVAGSIGPGTKLPTLGHTTYDILTGTYADQAYGLLEGGADLLLIETCQDLLQVKSAVAGAYEGMRRAGRRVPVITQVTVETTGQMLLGSDIAAALTAIEPLGVDVIGMNCATGPAEMGEHLRYLAQHARTPLSCLPNAGLPELRDGKPWYPLTPTELAEAHTRFASEFGLSIVGGCCGTTPEHIRHVVEALAGRAPAAREPLHEPSLSSLYQSVPLDQDTTYLTVGERCNANGSRKFRDLMLEGDLDGMVGVAKEQIREGAHVLDVCVDYVGRDGAPDMDVLAARLAQQSTVPVMLDSTQADVLEAGLKRLGGRAIINSINLEDGEARMDAVCPMARQYGAALVALLIDEDGQARDVDWKLRTPTHPRPGRRQARPGCRGSRLRRSPSARVGSGRTCGRRRGHPGGDPADQGRAARGPDHPGRLQRLLRPGPGRPPGAQLGVPARGPRGRARLGHRRPGPHPAHAPHRRRAAPGRPRPDLRPAP
jgi:5-methyltetrahydrofolate--homocysteine methyltransferase